MRPLGGAPSSVAVALPPFTPQVIAQSPWAANSTGSGCAAEVPTSPVGWSQRVSVRFCSRVSKWGFQN